MELSEDRAPKWPVKFDSAMRTVRNFSEQSPSACNWIHEETETFWLPGGVMPSSVTTRTSYLKGAKGEWILPPDAKDPAVSGGQEMKVLLWIVGGGLLACNPALQKGFLARICIKLNMPVLMLDYRKPPTCAFPGPRDDVAEAYLKLRKLNIYKQIYIGGDGAGANLVLSACRELMRKARYPVPDGLVLVSPWVDLSEYRYDSWSMYKEADVIAMTPAKTGALLYAEANRLDKEDVSPGLVKSWGGASFPRTFITFGEYECLSDQIQAMIKRMKHNKVRVKVHCGEEMVHNYPLFEKNWADPWIYGDPFANFFTEVDKFIKEAPLPVTESVRHPTRTSSKSGRRTQSRTTSQVEQPGKL